MYKILVTGDRNWTDEDRIREELEKYIGIDADVMVIQGGARGADSIASFLALELGFKVKTYNAKWKEYGKAAGVIRNRLMLKEHPDIDVVLAFHNDLEHGKGTKDMVKISEKAGKKVIKCTSAT